MKTKTIDKSTLDRARTFQNEPGRFMSNQYKAGSFEKSRASNDVQENKTDFFAWATKATRNPWAIAQHVAALQRFKNLPRVVAQKKYMKSLDKTMRVLKFENDAAYFLAISLLNFFSKKGITDVQISRTGNGELLLFREYEGDYFNLIIDEEGYVVFMAIPIEREKTYNEFYTPDEINISTLATKLLFA